MTWRFFLNVHFFKVHLPSKIPVAVMRKSVLLWLNSPSVQTFWITFFFFQLKSASFKFSNTNKIFNLCFIISIFFFLSWLWEFEGKNVFNITLQNVYLKIDFIYFMQNIIYSFFFILGSNMTFLEFLWDSLYGEVTVMTCGSIFQFYYIYFAEFIIYLITIGNYLVFQIYCYDVITVNHLVWFVTNNVTFENWKAINCRTVLSIFRLFILPNVFKINSFCGDLTCCFAVNCFNALLGCELVF